MEENIMKKVVMLAMVVGTVALTSIKRGGAVEPNSTDVMASVPTSFSFAEEQGNDEEMLILVESKEVYVWGDDNVIEPTTITVGYYIVRNDDETMSSVAQRLQLTEEYLMSANPDYKGEADDKLAHLAMVEIPDADWRSLSNVYCLVSEGNSLSQLAEYFYTSVDEILELNLSIEDVNMIYSSAIIQVH